MKKEKLLEIVHIILLEKDIHLLKAVLSNTNVSNVLPDIIELFSRDTQIRSKKCLEYLFTLYNIFNTFFLCIKKNQANITIRYN